MKTKKDYKRFADLPKSLQICIKTWCEPDNWGKSLKDVCEIANLNYSTVRNLIYNKVTANTFFKIKADFLDNALSRIYSEVLASLRKQIKRGNTRAIELYLKMTNRLAEKVEISGSIEIESTLLEAKKKAQEAVKFVVADGDDYNK